MSKKVLRPYQEEAIERVEGGVRQGNETGIIHFFTGGGKSVTAIETNKRVMPVNRGRSIMLAPARSLIFQMAQNYEQQWPELRAGVSKNNTSVPGLGVVMGSYNQPSAQVIIGSTQTLVDRQIEDYDEIEMSDIIVDRFGNIRKHPDSKRRVLVSERMDMVLANGGLPAFIQSDECHHSVADGTLAMFFRLQQLQKLLHVAPIIIVGYTATPVRNDGRGLFNLFKTIYISRSYRWAQREGYLVPFADAIRVVIDDGVDAVKISDTHNWVDTIVNAYIKNASGRQFMAFVGKMGDTGGVEASQMLANGFIEAGIPCAHTDGEKCVDQYGMTRRLTYRGRIYQEFNDGEITGLSAFGVGMEGLDLPPASCLLWARNTDNDVMKTQAVGRVLRLHERKSDALIIDFTGKEIELNPIGSLFGFSVNPLTQQYELDVTEEEKDEELDGVNIKDLRRKGEVTGVNTTYKIADIIAKQSTDWYRDEDTDFLSVSINDNQSLLISPPSYTKADRMQFAINDIIHVFDKMPNSYASDAGAEFEKMTETQLREWETLLQWLHTVYSNFTMWSIVSAAGKMSIENKTYAMYNSSLDTLLLDSVEYMSNIDNRIAQFSDRKKSWKNRDKITVRQRTKLKELGIDAGEDMRKGEASSLINYLMIKPVYTGFFNVIETFLKGKHIL